MERENVAICDVFLHLASVSAVGRAGDEFSFVFLLVSSEFLFLKCTAPGRIEIVLVVNTFFSCFLVYSFLICSRFSGLV